MANIQDLFREYVHLDRKRTGDGVSPYEYERWKQLKAHMAQTFAAGMPSGAAERRDSIRVPTRMNVGFETHEGLVQALMTNVSRGGFFINTAFPQAPGTRFNLRLQVESTGEVIEVLVQVVSNHIGPGLDTGTTGMGLRVLDANPETRKQLDDLYAELGASPEDD